jgi:hypothetical protein
MSAAQFTQSDERNSVPYITVGVDCRGSTAWKVITADQIIECVSGHRAVAVLDAAVRAKTAQ